VHEIKHDGYRLIVRRDGDTVRLFTLRGYDWTERYPAIARATAKLRAKSFTIDGEPAVWGPGGIAIFDALHRRGYRGHAVRLRPAGDRLSHLVDRRLIGIVMNDHTDASGELVFQQACRMGLEGIVSKRLSRPYQSGRWGHWLKVKDPDSPAMRRHRTGTW
jgi:bifunctional non-homologous end joining protein LigD